MEESAFTEDLITEIISRLPAKNLMRFTCVSKSWCFLIRTDPYFSRLHRSRTASIDRPCLFIEEMNQLASWSWLFYNYWIDLESVEEQSINLLEIHNPFPLGNARVVASCGGLLVLRQLQAGSDNNMLAVFNPITRKHVMVPPNPAGDDNVYFFGFGYDRVHDCYKLITRVFHRDRRLELMVYDLDKGTWRSLQFGMWWKALLEYSYNGSDDLYHNWDCEDPYNDIHYGIPNWDVLYFGCDLYDHWDLCHPKCVDGVVYWCFDVKRPRKMTMMVCFLLAEEEFHVVKPPDLGEVTKYYPNSLTVFDGKLGLVCQGLNTRHELWTMDMDYDDDGKRQWRWTKLLGISDVPPYFNDKDVLIPVCFSACKNKILILVQFRGYQLFWYDIVKKEFSKLNNYINGRCQEGRLFCYDMVKRKVHNPNNFIDCRRCAGIEIL